MLWKRTQGGNPACLTARFHAQPVIAAAEDAAIYACSVVAGMCFGDDPEDEDEEVDYEISWLEEDGGEYTAEIRPN